MFYINEFCHIDNIHFTFDTDQTVLSMSILFKYKREEFESVFESNCDASGWKRKLQDYNEEDFLALAGYDYIDKYFEKEYERYEKQDFRV